MKKQECIDAVAFAGVSTGRLIKQDVAPGVTLTEVSRANVAESGKAMLADQLRTTLQILLRDIPDDVELTAEHFARIEQELTTHYNFMIQSLLFPEMAEEIQHDKDVKLGKLAELRAQAV